MPNRENGRDRIGDYRLLQKLGEGAAGEVHLATPIEDKSFAKPGEPVALKLYKDTILQHKNQRERIQREFKVGSSISHPNLARIYDIGDLTKEQPYLVMEYVDGVPLSDWIHMFHPIAGSLLIRIVKQLVEGVRELHAKDIIHRDLKPANVMISSSFDARIMDFGVVHITTETHLTDRDKFVGTIRNASPEFLRNRNYDKRTDLYSLGTVIYTLLYGEDIFAEENQFVRLADAVEHTSPRFDANSAGRDQVCIGLLDLTQSLLKKNPGERPQSIDEVSQRVEQIGHLVKDIPPQQPLHGYVATALTGLGSDARAHITFASSRIADVAKQHGIYVYQPRRATDPVLHKDVEPGVVYAMDRARVVGADLLFVMLNKPSFGVGQELEIAATYGKPTLLIMEEGTVVSRMVTGSPANIVHEIVYSTPEDLERKLHRALEGVRPQVEAWRTGAGHKRHRITLGPKLKEARINCGYSTVGDLAKILGISNRLLEGIENGQIENVGTQVLVAIAAALRISVASLFDSGPSPILAPAADGNILRLEHVASEFGWGISEFLQLRTEYEQTKAARGSSEFISETEWSRRKNVHEQRVLERGSTGGAPPTELTLF